jgi:hypothetical protein
MARIELHKEQKSFLIQKDQEIIRSHVDSLNTIRDEYASANTIATKDVVVTMLKELWSLLEQDLNELNH